MAAICVQSVDVQCVLQFTLIHAAGCVLHRRTSRVIHRLKLFLISFALLPRSSSSFAPQMINGTKNKKRAGASSKGQDGRSLNLHQKTVLASPDEVPTALSPSPLLSAGREGPTARQDRYPQTSHFGGRRARPPFYASLMNLFDQLSAEPTGRQRSAGGLAACPAGDTKAGGTGELRASVARARPPWESLSHSLCALRSVSDLGNDPSAGSPTETLLRLLLPLNDQVRASSRSRKLPAKAEPRPVRGPH